MIRRRFLGAVGTSLLGAGCLSGNGGGGTTRLGALSVGNFHEDPQAIELRLEWEGKAVLDRTYDLPANDPDYPGTPSMVVDRTWPDDPGQFEVTARVRGLERETLDPASMEYPDCLRVEAIVDFDENLVLLRSTDPSQCSGAKTAATPGLTGNP